MLIGGASLTDLIECRVEVTAATAIGSSFRYAAIEGLVELAADVVYGLPIKLGRVGDEVEALVEPLGAEAQFGARVRKADLDPGPLDGNGVAAVEDLGAVEHAVGRQIDEGAARAAPAGPAGAATWRAPARSVGLVGDGLLDLLADGRRKVFGHRQEGIVLADGILDLPGGQVRQGALVFLTGSAEEVAVVLA